MAAQLISILSQKDEEKEKLKSDIESFHYQVHVFDKIETITKDVSINHPILIMIDYSSILIADRSKVINLFKAIKTTRTIVYNVPEDTDRRLAFYELGATRVFDKSYALENILHSVLWLADVLSTSDESKRLFSKGQLEDISLITLINTLGSENRSGILKIVTENNSGKIYFSEGDIISAEVGFHKGEDAIIHMLFWKKGDFSFSSSQNDAPERTIEISNIGIQIVSKLYQNRYRINLEKLGKSASTVRVQNIGDLAAAFEDIDPKFLDYISRPKTIEEALENSYYSRFDTLDILVKLKENKFLVIKDSAPALVEKMMLNQEISGGKSKKDVQFLLTPQDADLIKNNLKLKSNKVLNILLISSQNFATTGFINSLGNSIIDTKKLKKYLTIEVALADKMNMLVYAMQVDKQTMDTYKLLPDDIDGQIFIIELNGETDFEYMNYVIRQIYLINKAPTVLAVSNAGDKKDLTKLKSKISVPIDIKILPFDYKDEQKNIAKALVALKPPEIKDLK
ncbi:MAG: DUF4388 domain-containing protein [Calditrichaceae bacterium]|nr:DUF4388 domain-containing protein [Calditrichaceae bacterium]